MEDVKSFFHQFVDESFEVCKKASTDIYEIGFDIFQEAKGITAKGI